MAYEDITAPADNNPNQGGTNATLLFAPAADVDTDSVIGTVTNPEDEYIYTTGPVFKSGKKAHKVDIVVTSGQLEVESIGEDGGRAFKIAPTFKVEGNNLKALSLMNSPNGRFIFWIPMNNGQMVQAGTVKIPAAVIPAMGGGETGGSGSFFNFSIEAFNGRLMFLTGAVSTTPAA